MRREYERIYEFGPFRLDVRERQLRRNGQPVPLTPKAFETLLVLVERRGHLVEKEELMRALWPNSFVEEANLTNNVWTLRNALGESRQTGKYIETAPKRGYRFVAEVRVVGVAEEAAELVAEKHTVTRIITEEEEDRTNTDYQSAAGFPASPPNAQTYSARPIKAGAASPTPARARSSSKTRIRAVVASALVVAAGALTVREFRKSRTSATDARRVFQAEDGIRDF